MDLKNFGALFLLVHIYAAESWASPPSLSPSYKEIILSEGNTLELNCTSQKNVTFVYSSDTSSTHYMIQPTKEYRYQGFSNQPKITYEFDGENYLSQFKRERVIYQETGWYGCIESDKLIAEGWDGLEWIGLTPDYFNESDVSWTYVYIKTKKAIFVEEPWYEYILFENVGSDVFFSCRSTSPNAVAIFIMPTKRNLNFIRDPERGFTLKNVTFADSGKYVCYADGDFENKFVRYQLIVTDKNSTFYNPVIINTSSKSLIPGRTFRLSCSIIATHGHSYLLHWKIPNQNSSVSYSYSEAWNGNDSYKLTKDLIISPVSSEDEGVYECEYVSLQLKKRVSSKINITQGDNGIIALDDAVERFSKMKDKFFSIKIQMKLLFDDYVTHQSRLEKMLDKTLEEFNQIDASLKSIKNDVRYFHQTHLNNF